MEAAIRPATVEDLGLIRILYREYTKSLGFDRCFQGFEEEMTRLPGRYAPFGPPAAGDGGGEAAGCVASKKLTEGVCKLKRLDIRSRHRRLGVGRLLAERVIAEAREVGSQAVRLDTVPSVMAGAVALYRSLGFVEIPPDCFNPVPGRCSWNWC